MTNRHGEVIEPNQKVVDAVKLICAELNNISSSGRRSVAAGIYEGLAQEHRTIKQSFWSAILLAQIEYATDPFDQRNEQSVQLANRVKEVAIKNNFDFGLAFL
jgi:hypothetical protein